MENWSLNWPVLPTIEFDTLVVDGVAKFAGELEILLLDSYLPQDGDKFDILDIETIDGQFERISAPSLPNHLLWDFSELYESGEISVVPEPAIGVIPVRARSVVLEATLAECRFSTMNE